MTNERGAHILEKLSTLGVSEEELRAKEDHLSPDDGKRYVR